MKRRRGKYARTRKFQTRVKRALLKTAETKYYDIAGENFQLYHNNGYSSVVPPLGNTIPYSISTLFNPWADINQGPGRSSRIGDKIIPRGLKVKFWLANKLDRPNLMYRIIICTMPKTVSSVIVSSNNIQIFQAADLGSSNNHMIDPIDADKGVRCLYDRVHNVQVGFSANGNAALGAGSGRESHKLVKLWIKRKRARNIVFDSTGSIISENPLLFYVIPYDSYGSLNTDNVASVAFHCRLYYKDV